MMLVALVEESVSQQLWWLARLLCLLRLGNNN